MTRAINATTVMWGVLPRTEATKHPVAHRRLHALLFDDTSSMSRPVCTYLFVFVPTLNDSLIVSFLDEVTLDHTL